MTPNKSLVSESNRLTLQLIRAKWFSLLLLFIISTAVSLQLEDALSDMGSQSDSARILLAIAGAITDIGEGLILIFLLSWAIPQVRDLKGPQFLREPFNRPYISTLFAESLRVLGRILLWSLALILPGFIRYVQLSFVPLIVFFSQEYEDGNVDALALSTKMVNRRWKLMFGFMILMLILAAVLQLAPSHWVELHTMPIRVGFYFAGSLLSIWSYCLIFLVFEQEMQK